MSILNAEDEEEGREFEERFESLRQDLLDNFVDVEYPKKYWGVNSSGDVYLKESGATNNKIKKILRDHGVERLSTYTTSISLYGYLCFGEDRDEDGGVPDDLSFYLLRTPRTGGQMWGTRWEDRNVLIELDDYPDFEEVSPSDSKKEDYSTWSGNDNPCIEELISEIGIENSGRLNYKDSTSRLIAKYTDVPVECFSYCNRELVFIVRTKRTIKGIQIVSSLTTNEVREISLSKALSRMESIKDSESGYSAEGKRVKKIRKEALMEAI